MRRLPEQFRPDRLRMQEQREIAAVNAGKFDGKGDFGSYYAYARGEHREWMRSHGMIEDWTARRYAADVRSVAQIPRRASLCDLGCGLGVVTEALRHEIGGNATGIDISASAIAYAQVTFPHCTFLQMGLEGTSELPQQFDVIHAKAFYPFTRTDDPVTHNDYLALAARFLRPGGTFIAVVSRGTDEPGLLQTIERGELDYPAAGLTPLTRQHAAFTKLRNRLPVWLARPLSLAIVAMKPTFGRSIICVARKINGTG